MVPSAWRRGKHRATNSLCLPQRLIHPSVQPQSGLYEDVMVSSFVIAAAEGFEPEDRPRVVDKIVAELQFVASEPEKPSRSALAAVVLSAPLRRESPRGPPVDDDLEERLEDKRHFSINELADLAGKSPATIFRSAARSDAVHSRRRSSPIPPAVVLDFLRNGMRVPTLYRRCADGKLDFVMVGSRRALTRATMREKAVNGI